MKELKGKTAFITGAASGLGLGIAKACAKEGMKVILVDFRQNAIDEALRIFKENDWPAHGINLDVSDREAYVLAADEAEAVFGNIHLLVNNAGVGIREGNVWEASYEDMDFIIEMNIKSILNGIKTVLPRILKHGEGGHVTSTSSSAGLITIPGSSLYNLTKRAVMALMETVAADLQGTGVTASVFCPGPFKTNLIETTKALREKAGTPPAPVTPIAAADKPMPGDPAAQATAWRDPDDIGVLVIRGIQNDDLFIQSHAEFKPGWEEYAAAVSRSFPEGPFDENFMKAFPHILSNPVYRK
jgi:NAD(P)-dependent dehydrogenase (short-subunit alcohol dehydrogenase family)